jgi:RNA polymerase sigma factor (sigma-70 family)
MKKGSFTSVLQFVHRLAHPETSASSDRELLDRFIERRDETAFEILVRRHGPMVLGVSRRLLADAHDVEDAFQATFLLLVKKAAGLRRREQVSAWLYGVARRTALKLHGHALRRLREGPCIEVAIETDVATRESRDLRPLLDEEVQRLPQKYRLPVILCYLQGMTFTEAARQLGCPAGTLSSRLARARLLLRKRLTKRGIGVSIAGLTSLLSECAGAATPPVPLVTLTVQAACLIRSTKLVAAGPISATVAALVEGVSRSMFMSKMQTVGVLCLAVIALGGGGIVTYQTLGAQPPAAPKATAPANPLPALQRIDRGPVPADEDDSELVALTRPGLSAAKVDSLLKVSTASDKMKTLLKARYAAAVAELEDLRKELLAGRAVEDLCSASERLLRAETDICTNNADRILALEAHLHVVQKIELINKARSDAGRIPTHDLKRSEFLALDAEIALERLKSQKD